MTRDELKVLMATAASVDPYFPAADSDVLDAWHMIVGDVPAKVAAEAFRAHYRATNETIRPHDIVEVYRARRQHELEERDRPAPASSPEQIRAGVDRAIAALAQQKALKAGEEPHMAVALAEGEAAVRREYRTRPCSYCKAREGQPCVDGKGRPLTKTPAHPSRMSAAEVAARAPMPVRIQGDERGSSRT
ncbi:hypothetical protein Lesp02_70410 [Lentzea sp. NBRC 105346]|uniref:zinc finger domain-containing protein n=1 Tax=Lentzea sp. NBRC 105346 TaxID=3032205 RepID=UPI0024A47759|nr:hypothetical protein [Lentzea sp. NBRC 105346]GLZ34854.1 hypothetical protein Lesp02_70410 [Lentzea sp. NBRC 105346]